MKRKAKSNKRAGLLQLPREVVQHIYSVKEPREDDREVSVLSLRDRVRALAVCKAWKAYLDPRTWPIEALDLDSEVNSHESVALWVASTQPAVRAAELRDFPIPLLFVTLTSISPRAGLSELTLYGDQRMIRDSFLPLGLLTSLKVLNLDISPNNRGGDLDLSALRPLTALQQLRCTLFQRVNLKGSALLPQLVGLEVKKVGDVNIDAALPRLQRFEAFMARSVQLAGEQLQLPQLSQLSLCGSRQATVQWHAASQLADIIVCTSSMDIDIGGWSALPGLTSLALGYSQELIHAMLLAAPTTVQYLHLLAFTGDWDQPSPAGAVPQLTSLICQSPAIVSHLGPLARLEYLTFTKKTLMDLSLEQLEWLCSLTSLHKLSFGQALGMDIAVDRRMQMLTKLLPIGCIIEQPTPG